MLAATALLLAAAVLQNPAEQAALRHVSICAGNVRVQQDPRFTTLLPAQAQRLPLDSVSSWPIWVVKQGGKLPVTRVPVPREDFMDDILNSWCPPAAFEQLWLPQDLPTPQAHAAIGLVLRNGEPRYIFPTIDTVIEVDGELWRNRGLNSVPLASTWLHFGELPVDSLRLSAYLLPAADDDDDDESSGGRQRAWRQILPNRPVAAAIDAAFDALDALPAKLKTSSSLGDGFCYLISPLLSCSDDEEEEDNELSHAVPAEALVPGARLRVFLSEEGADEDASAWQRGELDLTGWALPPGKQSPYMQKHYKPLYERVAVQPSKGEP